MGSVRSGSLQKSSHSRHVTRLLALAVFALAVPFVQAQTYSVIHDFTGSGDGDTPFTGLTIDQAGSLYGTTVAGGAHGHGVVFRMKRSGSGWVLNPLYSFAGGTDGASPQGRVTIA